VGSEQTRKHQVQVEMICFPILVPKLGRCQGILLELADSLSRWQLSS
jgi:hypothetical protein